MRFYYIAVLVAILAPTVVIAAIHPALIINNTVIPQHLVIQSGDSVIWTNKDNAIHTVTANNGLFNSGDMSSNVTYTTTFKDPGNVSYYCIVHPAMTGSITVEFAALPSLSSHLEIISPSILILLSIVASFIFLPLL